MEVKCANKNKLGKIIKNGVALVVLAGGLTIINPVKSNGGYDIVNAAVDLSETKEDAINELKTVYKKYLKKYYTSKSYTKLTKYYKKGVELIKNATTINKIDAACEKYKELMEGIKPYYLVKYQNKMITKVESSYNKLVSKNSYSDSNLEALEDLKNEGIEVIKNAVTKTKAKKAKSSYITKMNGIKTKLQQVREEVANYLETQNMTQEEKNKILEQVNNMSENDIEGLLKEYGYEVQEEYVETNPNKLTVAILNDEKKFAEFVEKWSESFDDKCLPYYYTLSGFRSTVGETTHKYMIYLINYQYVDSREVLKDYTNYINTVTETLAKNGYTLHDVESCIDELEGIISVQLNNDLAIDFDSLIIENNETKGVGILINKIMKAINKEDHAELKKLFNKYFEKYLGKNVVLDTMVRNMLTSVYYIDTEYKNSIQESITKMLRSGAEYMNIRQEYFLKDLYKNKVYQK